MADEPEVEEVTEEVTEEVEDTTEDDNWAKMRGMIGEVVEEKLTAWQAKQPKTTTSSRSPRKAAAPKRKQGFLTGGFFSGLTDDK